MKPLRLLVVGGGGIGERHVRCLLKSRPAGALEVELCEPRRDRAVDLLEKHALVTVHPAFERVDLSRFDAAVVATPANLHLAQAGALVAAGCHVLVEKPLCVRESERRAARALLAAARRRRRVVAVGYTYRSYPLLMRLFARLGGLGRPRMARARLAYDYPRYRPDWRGNYFAREASGGGALLDIASHALAFLAMALGPVESVQALAGRQGLEGVAVEDTALLLLRFRSGVLAEVWTSACQPRREAEIEIIGERGHLRWVNSFDGTSALTFTRGDGDPGRHTARKVLDGDEPFAIQAAAFLAAVENRGAGLGPLASLADGLHVQEACWAARRSARTGRREKVPG